MRNELEYIAQIDAYLEGSMSSEELLLFEKQLENNAELKEEVLFQKEANQLLIIGELHDLEKRVKNYNYKSPTKNNNTFKNGALGLAGMLLLAGLFIYFLNTTNTKKLGTSREVTLTTPTVNKEPKSNTEKRHQPIEHNNKKSKDSTSVFSKKIKNTVDPVEEKTSALTQKDSVVTDELANKEQVDSIWNKPVISKQPEPKVIDTLSTTQLPKTTEEPKEDILNEDEVEVPNKSKTEPNYDLAFSPSQGQVLRWPVEEGFEGDILLYNMNGQIIHEKKFNGYENTEWDGITTNGNLITFGVYPMIIRPLDGTQPIQGSVTIIE